ncbi:MAG: Stk1 family PASTA domain-containing Ser/Thr kinase, partial [Sciscionella sp.]
MAGTVFDARYRVDSLLARGGMSSVYNAHDMRLDRPVALKVLERRFAEDSDFLNRFRMEARATARLRHPHVVAVYDQGVEQGLPYLVLELLEGGTLRDLFDRCGPLEISLALNILDAVVSALAAAHREGLVHCDIKPENVLFDLAGTIKVGDFGLARAAVSSPTTGDVIVGTVAYLSPEQVADSSADTRSDVYSAGILLYEALVGNPPYAGTDALTVAYRHVNEDVPAPSAHRRGLSPAVDELVLRATRRDPSARPCDGIAFLTELRGLRERLRVDRSEMVRPNSTTHLYVSGGRRETLALDRGASRRIAITTDAEPDAQGEPSPKRLRRTLIRAFLIALPLLLLVSTATWWFGSGRWTTVPRVIGMDRASAQQAFDAAHLRARVINKLNNLVTADHVVTADPAVGTRSLRGDAISVVISQGRPTVPDVAPGTSQSEARQLLTSAGLRPRTDGVTTSYDDTAPKGTVVRTKPPAGTGLNIGARVTLVLSSGQAPISVPDVTGMARAEAFTTLHAVGLQPFDLPGQFSDSVDAGKVISTDPPSGQHIQRDGNQRIGVVLSNTVTVPLVLGQTISDARITLQAAGLTAVVQQGFDQDAGRVFSQSLEPGTRVQAGTE